MCLSPQAGSHLPVSTLILSGTECCPINWVEHGSSCYWFSHSGLTWPEAEKYCQLENAHLVVINSREEQKFIVQHMSPFHTWIGLTESDGSWKWVDGTDYDSSYKNWAATQPDNWHGHEEGGSEDCAEIQMDGRWNDDLCQEVQRWACEMRQKHYQPGDLTSSSSPPMPHPTLPLASLPGDLEESRIWEPEAALVSHRNSLFAKQSDTHPQPCATHPPITLPSHCLEEPLYPVCRVGCLPAIGTGVYLCTLVWLMPGTGAAPPWTLSDYVIDGCIIE